MLTQTPYVNPARLQHGRPWRLPNHVDDPMEYVSAACPCCVKCLVHFQSLRCIYGGPFQQYQFE